MEIAKCLYVLIEENNRLKSIMNTSNVEVISIQQTAINDIYQEFISHDNMEIDPCKLIEDKILEINRSDPYVNGFKINHRGLPIVSIIIDEWISLIDEFMIMEVCHDH